MKPVEPKDVYEVQARSLVKTLPYLAFIAYVFVVILAAPGLISAKNTTALIAGLSLVFGFVIFGLLLINRWAVEKTITPDDEPPAPAVEPEPATPKRGRPRKTPGQA
jgi:hypothetical protein